MGQTEMEGKAKNGEKKIIAIHCNSFTSISHLTHTHTQCVIIIIIMMQNYRTFAGAASIRSRFYSCRLPFSLRQFILSPPAKMANPFLFSVRTTNGRFKCKFNGNFEAFKTIPTIYIYSHSRTLSISLFPKT